MSLLVNAATRYVVSIKRRRARPRLRPARAGYRGNLVAYLGMSRDLRLWLSSCQGGLRGDDGINMPGCGITILMVALALAVSCAHAQVAPETVTPNPPVIVQAALPLVDPAHELKGRALIEALRKGGYVLYMRHALQIPPTTEKCDMPSLTPVGEEQARTVGAAIRELKIPIGQVRSSQVCRNRDTARLLGFGAYEITEDLNPAGLREGVDVGPARSRQLIEMPPRGTNTLLVSHVHGSKNKAEWMHLELAEMIVYRPDGKGETMVVARVRVEGWGELLKLMGEAGR